MRGEERREVEAVVVSEHQGVSRKNERGGEAVAYR